MTVQKEDIKEGLKKLGLKRKDMVLVHSSLSSFGYVIGGVNTVVDAILEIIGEEGTLIVPTFPFRGLMYDYISSNPLFDVRNTPSLMGIITETVRLREKSLRSLDPSHSVASIGKKASYITKGHENSLKACGIDTPFGKNIKEGGYILLLGVTHSSNTTLHTVEETAEPDYIYDESRIFKVKVIDWQGRERITTTLPTTPNHPRDFDKIEPLLIEKGVQVKGKIGNSIIRLVKASDLFGIAMEEIKKDPTFLLKKKN